MGNNVTKTHILETFRVRGLGRAKGFANDPDFNPGLIHRVKNKIKTLYEQYFVENGVKLWVPTIPGISLDETPKLSLNVPIIVKSEVKMVG